MLQYRGTKFLHLVVKALNSQRQAWPISPARAVAMERSNGQVIGAGAIQFALDPATPSHQGIDGRFRAYSKFPRRGATPAVSYETGTISGCFVREASRLRSNSKKETIMKKQFAIAASVMALAATPLLADMHEDAEHEFPLTMDEFMEAYPEVAPEQFMLIDTDGDGQVSEEEYDSAREAGIIGGEDDI